MAGDNRWITWITLFCRPMLLIRRLWEICLPPVLIERTSASAVVVVQYSWCCFQPCTLRNSVKRTEGVEQIQSMDERSSSPTINQVVGHSSEIDCYCSTKRRWQESSIVRAVDVDAVQALVASWIGPKMMMMMMFPCVPIVSYIHARVYVVRTRRARGEILDVCCLDNE